MDRLTDEQISATLFLMDGDQYYDDPSGYFEIALTELQQARAEIERLRAGFVEIANIPSVDFRVYGKTITRILKGGNP